MKTPAPWMTLVSATTLFFAACDKKDEVESAVEKAASDVVDAVEKAVAEVTPMSAEDRAKKLGIVGHLAADTECVLALYQGREVVANLAELDTWQFVREVIKEEEGVDPEEEIAEGGKMVGDLLGEEIFIAFGGGTAPQIEGLMEVNARMGYHQLRLVSRALAEGAAEGDLDRAAEALGNNESYLMELFKDVGRLMPVVEQAQVPPVLVGIKVSDESTRNQALDQMNQVFSMFASEAELVEVTKGGADLKGYLFKGAMIAEERIAGLIFFVDPLTAMPHDVDVKALTRLAVVYDIPMALNQATAELLLSHPSEIDAPARVRKGL